MPPAPYPSSSAPSHARGRRAVIFALVVAVHVLLVVVLMMLAPPPSPRPPDTAPRAFTLTPLAGPTLAKAVAPRAKRSAGGAPPRSTPRPAPPRPKPPVPPKPFGTELFDAVDIAALPNHRAETADTGGEGTGAGADSGSAYGPGGGAGGERLYQAEWYTEPTHAELAYYLPKTVPQDSWGMIACRTVEKYHVDDCRELSESPAGSGLARALRQAAWQFRVLPPRIGGRQMVGAWVSIRVDFTEDGVKHP